MKIKILAIILILGFVALMGIWVLNVPGRKGEIVFYGFPEFDYAQFNEASRNSQINFKRIDSLLEQSSSLSNKDVLLLRTMGKLFSKEEENVLYSVKNRGVKIVDFFPISKDKFTSVNKKVSWALKEYYRNGSIDNYVGLLKYIKKNLLKENIDCPRPIIIPSNGLFSGDGKFFSSLEEFSANYKDKITTYQGKPKIALIAVNIIPQNIYNEKMLKFIIEYLEKSGCLVYPIMGFNSNARNNLLSQIKPDVIICAAHGKIFDSLESKKLLQSLDAPIILSVNLLAKFTDWAERKDNVDVHWIAQSLVVPELDGAIEPIVVSALAEAQSVTNSKDPSLILKPIEERVAKLVRRAYRWVSLRRKANKDKKIAVIFYPEQGKSSSNMSGLDFSPSLFNFLKELKSKGFDVGVLPEDKEKLQSLISKNCTVFGEWAKGTQRKFLDENQGLIKISNKDFLKWCEFNLEESLKDSIFSNFPKDSETKIAFPALRFGNIIVFPLSSSTGSVDSSMSSHNISGTPSINYCAQYLWIKEGFGADAVIHFGTHGSLEFLEGKDVLLSQKDWTDALITDLPNGYIYIVDDPAEALIAKRRSFAVILSHLAPMFAEAGLYAELKILAEDMHSYLVTESAELKQGYLEKVHKALLENKLDKLLSLEEMNKYPLTDAQLRLVHDRFHSLSKELIPMGLHIYGELPSKERITEMLYCLKKEEVEKALRNSLGISGGLDCQIEEQIKPLALELIYKTIDGKDMVAILDKYANAEQLAVILQNVRNVSEKIDYSEKEIESAVRFLEGKYIFPSPGGDMIFNPNVLPTGRNLFGIDPESVPTRAAFMAGEKSAEKIRNKFLKNENKPLEKIAFTLWGVNTVMDQGITESQILWFLGARPIYDQADNCVDVELIPSSELKRARIDVLVQVSGEYRDIFGSRLKLLDKAIKLAAQEKNEIIENFVRKHSLEMEKDFVAEGISLAEAKRLSLGRIFGPKERAYSIAARQMYKNTSLWNSETDIAQVYIDNMSGLYSSDSWGKLEDILFKKVARDLDVIVQSRSMKRIGGPLSLDHTYEFSGGLNIAVRSLSDNKSAKIYFSDNRVLNNPEIVSLKEAIVNEALSAMFNPKFIEALMENKLSGAAELKNLIENLYGWQITSPEDVDDELWLKTFEIYFKDKYDIKLDEFLKANNLFVYQDIAAVMLDAIRKGYWNADQSVKKDLAKVFGDLISIHGPSCSERLCANSALLNYMERYFQSTKDILNKHELALYMDNIKAALGNKGKKAKGSAKVDLGIIQILKKN